MESPATPGTSVLGKKLLAALYYCGSSMTVQFMNKVVLNLSIIYEHRTAPQSFSCTYGPPACESGHLPKHADNTLSISICQYIT